MSSSFDDLIAESRAAACASGAWLGSDEQREMLERALEPIFGLVGWTLKWLPASQHSYAKGSMNAIAIERITSGAVPLPDDEVAEYVALSLLHEVLHARYSTSWGSFTPKRALVSPLLQPSVDYLFQRIEDARVQRLAIIDEPSIAAGLRKFHDEGIRQREVEYRSQFSGTEPWTTSPPSQRGQLFLAVERRLFHPGEKLTLDLAVEAELIKCEASLEGVWGGNTEDAGIAAIAVVAQIYKAGLTT